MQKGLLVKRLLVETIEDFLMRDKEDTKMLKELLGVETLSAEDKYLINYNAIGWSSTMVRWILNGCQEDPKELITILDALTPKKMLHYYREAAFINNQA